MTKGPSAGKSRKHVNPPEKTQPPAKPLKPRPRLFIGLMAVLALWIAFLGYLYLTTVRPREKQPHILLPATTRLLP
jgi:hypothetical protein